MMLYGPLVVWLLVSFFGPYDVTQGTASKLLYIHGGADNYTLPNPCEEHVKRIKAKPGQVKIDIKEGWYHGFHSGRKPWKI